VTSLVSRRHLLELGTLALPVAALSNEGCRSAAPDKRSPTSERLDDARAVTTLVPAVATLEGAGVRLRRSIGSRALSLLDPFLLLDEIHSDVPDDYLKGFPTHPHRGFETVTYVIDGAIEHKDSVGNQGRLTPGSAQWMTAGHGIVHSEMPNQDRGTLWALQLWVNLPRARKMTPPRYQDIHADRIPELGVHGARVRLVAGAIGGEHGPVEGIAVEPTLFDVSLSQGGRFEHHVLPEASAFIYVLEGVAELGSQRTAAAAGMLAALGPGRVLETRSSAGARFLLVAGRALNEPVARRGPFVMNTEEELDRAFEDYRTGRLIEG
jgi:redox-sensitive bicupin YhaK (pirin superfamily)